MPALSRPISDPNGEIGNPDGEILKVKDLSVKFDGAQILEQCSMEVPSGIVVSLIGANGAGKTTLLRTITGLNRPATGTIWFGNRCIDTLSPENIVKLGIVHVPEGRQLFQEMTVRENLWLGAYLRKDVARIREDFSKVLELFPNLKGKLRQLAGSMSGGEQQMVAIGRALMARPKLLLADEPSLGLAPIVVEQITDILLEINKSGVTILLVEQNAYMALQAAQRAYVIENGRITLSGSTFELMENEQVRKSYLGL